MSPVLAGLGMLSLILHVGPVALHGSDNGTGAIIATLILCHLYTHKMFRSLPHISAVDAADMGSLFEFLGKSRVVVE